MRLPEWCLTAVLIKIINMGEIFTFNIIPEDNDSKSTKLDL